MHRQFIGIILALSVATAGLAATPVQAQDRNENAALLTGLAALAVIGAAIAHDKKKERRKRRAAAARNYGGYAPVYNDPGYVKDRHHHKHLKRGHKHAKKHHRRDHNRHYRDFDRPRQRGLPSACRVRHGDRLGYSGRCLRNRYAGFDTLPRRCAVPVGGRHGTVYRDRCLNRYGY